MFAEDSRKALHIRVDPCWLFRKWNSDAPSYHLEAISRTAKRRLMDAYTEELDTTMRPELQELLLRRYKKGDATDNKHRDTFSLAVLHYWGDFGGDNLEYKVGTQVASVPLKQGDLIIMCGSRIRHGCKESTSGHRYALVGFHNLVAPTKKSHGDK